MSIAQEITKIQSELSPYPCNLIVVTKTRSIDELQQVYNSGIFDFGENRVQEMVDKQAKLPSDIRWHQIGHLQTNKVKYIAPFIDLIHSVDSISLLKVINKQAEKYNRVIPCLLQIYIAQEDTKFGLDKQEAIDILQNPELTNFANIQIIGLMGMATFTDNTSQIQQEFKQLKALFDYFKSHEIGLDSQRVVWQEISMGMSGDYLLAAQEGSTMVRVGSAIFGPRT
jgi:pyridoxal phosphate enzyme (YggS family)